MLNLTNLYTLINVLLIQFSYIETYSLGGIQGHFQSDPIYPTCLLTFYAFMLLHMLLLLKFLLYFSSPVVLLFILQGPAQIPLLALSFSSWKTESLSSHNTLFISLLKHLLHDMWLTLHISFFCIWYIMFINLWIFYQPSQLNVVWTFQCIAGTNLLIFCWVF